MIILKDYYEILHLHQALLEGKFSDNPNNKLVSGSPNVAKICNIIVDELIDLNENNEKKEKWEKWRKINSHNQFFKIALNNAKKAINHWGTMSNEAKIDSIKNYLSPFVCDEEDLKVFLDEINKC